MTQYHSKPVSEHGHIDWDLDEHAVWHELIHSPARSGENQSLPSLFRWFEYA